MEKIMKKKIIILVSIIAFLLLVGGGIAAYYFWYVPEKKRQDDIFYAFEKFSNECFELIVYNKFHEAEILLNKWRKISVSKKYTQITKNFISFHTYDIENHLWYAQGKYEKIKDNLPKMKLLLATLNDGRFSQKELLGSKWAFCNSKFDYYYVSKRLKEAFDTIEEFITECGGEKKIGEVNPRILYGIYSAKARCLFALNQLDESVQYSHKILQYDNDPVVQHVTYLRLARLELFYRQKANYPLACKYVIKANNNIQSQEGYLLLSYIHLKQGRKEEAKKYYSLTLQCKRYPLADEKDLVKLKKLLVE